ncbi:hypothetical protein ARTHRO9AX_180552 [Arthrobacter sp. 9AX]|nr:hypothetical protein ARTHRO9AX_180552 [Arthrobacter sp. 9AX]
MKRHVCALGLVGIAGKDTGQRNVASLVADGKFPVSRQGDVAAAPRCGVADGRLGFLGYGQFRMQGHGFLLFFWGACRRCRCRYCRARHLGWVRAHGGGIVAAGSSALGLRWGTIWGFRRPALNSTELI